MTVIVYYTTMEPLIMFRKRKGREISNMLLRGVYRLKHFG